jgi:hypothetical protein
LEGTNTYGTFCATARQGTTRWEVHAAIETMHDTCTTYARHLHDICTTWDVWRRQTKPLR